MLNSNLKNITLSSSEDTLKYKNYIETLPSKNWEVYINNTTFISLTTPNKGTINLTKNIDWDISPDSQYQSTLMWFYSLEWLIIGYKKGILLNEIEKILDSFYIYVSSPTGEERLSTLTSRDHMSAMLLQNLSYMTTLDNQLLKDSCCKLVSWLLPWCITSENIKQNNHGMMLCSAIMHACIVFNFENKDEIYIKAKTRLTEVISSAFDSTGLCVENSPAYHAFYIRYIKGLIKEAKTLFENDEIYIRNFDNLLEKVHQCLSIIALPNGSLPSLGDGNDGFFPEITEGITDLEYLSTESGLYVSKQDNIYFSMKCGQSSITHKHVDDNSITLYVDGQPIIMDCGLYNYDWQDPFTSCVKSQRGHSGAYWSKFDNLYPGTLYRQDNMRVTATLTKITYPTSKIIGFSSIDNQYNVSREVTFGESLEKIYITDKFSGPKQETKVIRFILDGDLSLHLIENHIFLENDKLLLTLKYNQCKPNIYRGNKSSNKGYMGWKAINFGKAIPVWSIDLIVDSNIQECFTEITLTKKQTSYN